jgi:hypothetical protein
LESDNRRDTLRIDTGPWELSSKRHRQAVGRIAIALVIVVSASVGYVRSTTTSPLGALRAELSPQAQGRSVTLPYVEMSPGPSASGSPASVKLPRAGIISILLEQFAGQNDQSRIGWKTSVYITEVTAIRKLVHQLNTLPQFPAGIVSCAISDGAYYALVFTYSGGISIAVRVEAGGCGRVYVGSSSQPVAWTLTSPAVVDTFKDLLPTRPAS